MATRRLRSSPGRGDKHLDTTKGRGHRGLRSAVVLCLGMACLWAVCSPNRPLKNATEEGRELPGRSSGPDEVRSSETSGGSWLGVVGCANDTILARSGFFDDMQAPVEVALPVEDGRVWVRGLDAGWWSIQSGSEYIGEIEVLSDGRVLPDRLSCQDTCTLMVEISAAEACRSLATVELRQPAIHPWILARKKVQLDALTMASFSGLSCSTELDLSVVSEGCPEEIHRVSLTGVTTSVAIDLVHGVDVRLILRDASTGSAVSGVAFAEPYGSSIVVDSILGAKFRVRPNKFFVFSSEGYIDRLLGFSENPAEPGSTIFVDLEPMVPFEVRCEWESDGRPCLSSEVELVSVPARESPHRAYACTALATKGVWSCMGGAPVSSTSRPEIRAFDAESGELMKAASLSGDYGLPVELVIPRRDDRTLCVNTTPGDAESCRILYGADNSRGSRAWSIDPGSEAPWPPDMEPGSALLLCIDGYALIPELVADRCVSVELHPSGTVCVDHQPRRRCWLVGGPVDRITGSYGTMVDGCNEDVVPGDYQDVRCLGEGGWIACPPVTVEPGATTSIECR